MTANEKARELLAQQRQHDRHLTDAMRDRAEDALEQGAEHLREQAREILTEERQHAEHLKDTMRERAETEVRQ